MQTNVNQTTEWKYLKVFRKCDEEFKGKQKGTIYNTRHRVRQLPSLSQGTEVWVTTGNGQTRGQVTSSANAPQSYIVNTADVNCDEFIIPTPSSQPPCKDGSRENAHCMAQPREAQYVPGMYQVTNKHLYPGFPRSFYRRKGDM